MNHILGATIIPHMTTAFIEGIVWFIFQLLTPVLDIIMTFLYTVLVWGPLIAIDTLTTMFRYFSTGFMSQLFTGSTNPDGSINITGASFADLSTSVFYRIVLIIFTLSLMLFFINFLLKFVKRSNVDSEGNPVAVQTNRLVSLKWPLIMAVLLTCTPLILLSADSAINSLIGIFNPDGTLKISDTDKSQLMNSLYSTNGAFTVLGDISTRVRPGGMPYSDYIGLIKSTSSSMINELNNILQNPDNAGEALPDYTLTSYISYLRQILIMTDSIENYLISDLPNDYSRSIDIVSWSSPGSYLSSADSSALVGVVSRLQEFIGKHEELDTTIGKIGDMRPYDYAKMMRIFEHYDAALETHNTLIGLFDTWKTSYNMYNPGDSSVGYYVRGDTSAAKQVINGVNGIGLSAFATRIDNPDGIRLVKTLYTMVTGDSNSNHWNNGSYSEGISHFSLSKFIFAALVCWSFVILVYQFTKMAIERTFYIIYGWSIGWLYLAQGINDPKIPTKWYKALYGRWYSIIIFLVLFETATILSDAVWKPIYDTVNNDPVSIEFLDEGNIFAYYATAIAIESIFQVAYQFGESTTQSLWNATIENTFASNMQRSNALGAGQAYFQSAWKTGTAVAKRAAYHLTAGSIRSTVVGLKDKDDFFQNHIAMWSFGRERAEDGSKMTGKGSIGFLGFHFQSSRNNKKHDTMMYLQSQRMLNQKKNAENRRKNGGSIVTVDDFENTDYSKSHKDGTTDVKYRYKINKSESTTMYAGIGGDRGKWEMNDGSVLPSKKDGHSTLWNYAGRGVTDSVTYHPQKNNKTYATYEEAQMKQAYFCAKHKREAELGDADMQAYIAHLEQCKEQGVSTKILNVESWKEWRDSGGRDQPSISKHASYKQDDERNTFFHVPKQEDIDFLKNASEADKIAFHRQNSGGHADADTKKYATDLADQWMRLNKLVPGMNELEVTRADIDKLDIALAKPSEPDQFGRTVKTVEKPQSYEEIVKAFKSQIPDRDKYEALWETNQGRGHMNPTETQIAEGHHDHIIRATLGMQEAVNKEYPRGRDDNRVLYEFNDPNPENTDERIHNYYGTEAYSQYTPGSKEIGGDDANPIRMPSTHANHSDGDPNTVDLPEYGNRVAKPAEKYDSQKFYDDLDEHLADIAHEANSIGNTYDSMFLQSEDLENASDAAQSASANANNENDNQNFDQPDRATQFSYAKDNPFDIFQDTGVPGEADDIEEYDYEALTAQNPNSLQENQWDFFHDSNPWGSGGEGTTSTKGGYDGGD